MNRPRTTQESSMAIRKVLCRHTMRLDPRKGFKAGQIIPVFLLAEESPQEQQRIQRLWNQLLVSVNELCKNRRFLNKHVRKAVFDSGMENLCKDFSRQQVNLKVEWKTDYDDNAAKSCALELVRLSPVPASSLSGPWFTAEIPQILQEAQAELIGVLETSDESPASGPPEDYNVAVAVACDSSTPGEVPFAMTVTPIDESVRTTTAAMAPVQAVPIAGETNAASCQCAIGQRIEASN